MGYTKKKYIEKFGEAYYYEVVLPRNRERGLKYAHSEKGKAKRLEYYENNKEASQQQWKKRYETKRDEILQYHKEYAVTNKEKIASYQREYQKTQKGVAEKRVNGNNYKDKRRGYTTSENVDADWIVENIFTSKCIYCGDTDWKHLGCDRIDNSKPHTPDNVVCACAVCNVERQWKDKSVEEFIKYRQLHPRILDPHPIRSSRQWEIQKKRDRA